jgi:hypothetical protein
MFWPSCKRSGAWVVIGLGGFGKRVSDLELGLADDDARLLLARGLRFARRRTEKQENERPGENM